MNKKWYSHLSGLIVWYRNKKDRIVVKCFAGYHGTQIESARKIIRSGYFKFSDKEEEWLGRGIYFFEDDLEQAVNFCIKARKYQNWSVLKCCIKAEVVIDLIQTKDLQEFQRVADLIKTRYQKTKDGRKRELLNFVVLNMMYKAKPYDIVRAAFPVPKGYVADRTNIQPVQIQICVRNRGCIKTTEEVKNSEH